MTNIIIPASLDEARTRCAALEGLARATGWERAAIVWAFTIKDRPGPGDRITSDGISIESFARQGLPGLSSVNTVRRYHDAWQQAIDAGNADPVRPGCSVLLPPIPWPPANANLTEVGITSPEVAEAIKVEAADAGITANVVAQVNQRPAAISAAIKANPRIAAKAREALEVVDRRDRDTRNLDAIARGGRVVPLNEINRHVGASAMDGIIGRLDAYDDGLRLVRAGRDKLAELGVLSQEEEAGIRDAAVSLLDLFLGSDSDSDVPS